MTEGVITAGILHHRTLMPSVNQCKILSMAYKPNLDILNLYNRFDSPICEVDCGQICRQFNPSGMPFCCDICVAVPVALKEEWTYLKANTKLWHRLRGDECPADPIDKEKMQAETPNYMHLMACKGPAFCERDFRTLSCRQFPFSPYITADDRLIGLTYNWDFEEVCWVISNLARVSDQYRKEFLDIYDNLLFEHPSEYDSYYWLSEDMREHFIKQQRHIPILHRDGGYYLLNPATDEISPINPMVLPKFGAYKEP
jgi:hypothetical protein